jgi:UbiD family decarboxylase
MAAALGTTVAEAIPVLADRMETKGPVEVVADAPFLSCREEMAPLDRVVPLLRFDPGSPRPYTSSSIIVARSGRHGINLSFHRMMYLGDNRFSVRVVPRHLRAILDEEGGEARVAVIMGVHPALSIAAATSGGPEFDELAFAASILGGLQVVDLGGLLIPAQTELVLEGRFTGELAEEGPFVDLTGTLDGVRQQPVLQIDRFYHRPDFLYHTIVPGGVEHRLLMGTPQEPRILRAVSNTFPRVRQVALTAGGCHWLHAAISLSRPLPGQGRNVALAALGAHPSLKRVVVVDDDVDVHDAEQIEWAIATRVQPDRDVIIIPAARGSSLDPSRDPKDNTTAKWIIDATLPPGRDPQEFLLAQPDDVPSPSGRGEP